MNSSDSEIIKSILVSSKMDLCDKIEDSNLVIINTCAIRERAEQKVWTELENLNVLKQKKRKNNERFYIGVVGCMAERLKI